MEIAYLHRNYHYSKLQLLTEVEHTPLVLKRIMQTRPVLGSTQTNYYTFNLGAQLETIFLGFRPVLNGFILSIKIVIYIDQLNMDKVTTVVYSVRIELAILCMHEIIRYTV